MCKAEPSTVCPLPSKESCLVSEKKITSLDKLCWALLPLPLLRVIGGASQLSSECEVRVRLPSEEAKCARVSVMKREGQIMLDIFDMNLESQDLQQNREQKGRMYYNYFQQTLLCRIRIMNNKTLVQGQDAVITHFILVGES